MSVDEITKLMLFTAITLSILGVSFQFSRILGKIADSLQDFRLSIKNLGNLSTQLVDDYKLISNGLRAIGNLLEKINISIISPVSRYIDLAGNFLNKGRSKEEKVDIKNDSEK